MENITIVSINIYITWDCFKDHDCYLVKKKKLKKFKHKIVEDNKFKTNEVMFIRSKVYYTKVCNFVDNFSMRNKQIIKKIKKHVNLKSTLFGLL